MLTFQGTFEKKLPEIKSNLNLFADELSFKFILPNCVPSSV